MEANRGSGGGQLEPPTERSVLARAAGVLGGLTLVSRVTGLARDIVIGALFGASATADAFFVAFRIPNLFRRVVAEGASSTAFVPVFTSYREREGDQAALSAAAAVGGAAVLFLTVLVSLCVLFADEVVALFAPGFAADPAKQALTVRLTAVTFPYLALVGLAAWAMGTLHTFRRFAVPAIGPILLNLSIITAAVVLASRLTEPIYALVVGVLVGGSLQFLVQLPTLWRLGLPLPRLAGLGHAAVGRVGALLVPTLLGGAVYQVNILVATVFASLLPARSISYLWYADRIFEFPLGVVAVAIGTAALPGLARHASASRFREMAASTSDGLQLVWALCIPATVGLWMLAPAIVTTLFVRGEFTPTDAVMTADALRAYATGMFAVASVRVLVSVFYALERPRVPVLVAIVALLVNALADIALMGSVDVEAGWYGAGVVTTLISTFGVADLDHVGLAFGTALAATVNAGLLMVLAHQAIGGLPWKALGGSAARSVAAACVMASVVGAWQWVLAAVADSPSATMELGGGVLIGAATYVAAALALGSAEVRDLVKLFARRLR